MEHKLHAEYSKRHNLIKQVRDAIQGQEHVRFLGTEYLPMTSGMCARYESNDLTQRKAAEKQYEFYKGRARFPNIVQSTENGIVGVAFEKPPLSNIRFEKVTKNNRDVVSLAGTVLRETLEAGDSLMLVDAPAGGGDPYIAEYKYEDLADYALDDDDESVFSAIKLKETYFESGDTYKSEPKTRYREYLMQDERPTVHLTDDDGIALSEPVTLDIPYIPLFVAGSVDNMPTKDPIPLLSVSDSAYAIYRISADYMQYLHGYWQGTPWATGVTSQEADQIFSMGTGVGSFIALSNPDAELGMLQPNPTGDEGFIRAIENELKSAEQYAISISQGSNGVEAAESIRLRAITKHATIYTIFNSVSSAIQDALNCMSEWSGQPQDNEFKLNTDFTASELSAQLVTALTGSINAEILPPSVLKNAARKAGLSELTDEEMHAEILETGGGAI